VPSHALPPVGNLFRAALLALLVFTSTADAVDGTRLRVAVIGSSPPMSYVDGDGRLVGFNVEFAQALCEVMKVTCELLQVPMDRVVDAVADGRIDFAAVSLLATPERKQQVLFTKPYYRSVSVMLARSLPDADPATQRIALVRGSEQARYAGEKGWQQVPVATHRELAGVLAAGDADAAFVPMLTAVGLMQDERLRPLALFTRVLNDLAVDVCLAVNPRQPALRERIDAAIDRVKADGRFDRINTRYLPFRLQ